MTRRWETWGLALGMTIAAAAASALLYSRMPDRMPIHWNIHGEIDGYGSRDLAAFGIPAMMAGMLLLFAALPYFSPNQFRLDSFRSTYEWIMVLTVGLIGYIHGITLYAGIHGGKLADKALIGGMMLFFALMGNLMGKVRRNFFVGIKVPWTLASDRVWNDTHRLAAWLWTAGGLLGFVLTMVGVPVYVAFGILVVMVVIPIGYSFWLSKRLEKEPPSEPSDAEVVSP